MNPLVASSGRSTKWLGCLWPEEPTIPVIDKPKTSHPTLNFTSSHRRHHQLPPPSTLFPAINQTTIVYNRPTYHTYHTPHNQLPTYLPNTYSHNVNPNPRRPNTTTTNHNHNHNNNHNLTTLLLLPSPPRPNPPLPLLQPPPPRHNPLNPIPTAAQIPRKRRGDNPPSSAR